MIKRPRSGLPDRGYPIVVTRSKLLLSALLWGVLGGSGRLNTSRGRGGRSQSQYCAQASRPQSADPAAFCILTNRWAAAVGQQLDGGGFTQEATGRAVEERGGPAAPSHQQRPHVPYDASQQRPPSDGAPVGKRYDATQAAPLARPCVCRDQGRAHASSAQDARPALRAMCARGGGWGGRQ